MALERANQTHFSVGQLLKQIKIDLIAKEVQTGYTVTYAWLANQVGHYSLGVLWVLWMFWVLWAVAQLFGAALGHNPAVIVTLAVVGFAAITWLEVDDVVQSKRDAQKEGVFPLDARKLKLDAITAIYFVAAGLWAGLLFLALPSEYFATHLAHIFPGRTGPWISVVTFVLEILIAGCWGKFWLSQKKCFQQANLPFIFRLANFPNTFDNPPSEQAADMIMKFVGMRAPFRHLIIAGPLESGKTTLASAIGTEHTFQLGKARYITLSDLIATIGQKDDPNSSADRPLWHWDEGNILIVDDVDLPLGSKSYIEPDQAMSALTNPADVPRKLRSRQTAWVISEPQNAEAWRRAIGRLLNENTDQIQIIVMKHKENLAIRLKAKGKFASLGYG